MSDLGLLGTGAKPGLAQDSNGPLLLIASTVMTAIMLAIVLCRFWSRGVIMKTMGPDDITIIPAVALSVSMAVITAINVGNGAGKHIWNINVANMQSVFKGIFLGNIHYVLLLAFAKMSMLFQLYRITAPHSTTRKFLIAVFSVSIMFSLVNFFISVFNCQPISYSWTRVDPRVKGTCLGLKTVSYTTSVFHIVTDFAIWLAPMPLIWHLQLPKAQKIGLFGVFSLGGLACIASVARFVTVARFANNPAQLKDSSFHQVPSVLWSVAEANIVIICACLPTIRPLLKSCLPTVFGTTYGTRGTPGYLSARVTGKSSNFGNSGVSHSVVSTTPYKPKPIMLQDRQSHQPYGEDLEYTSSTEELATPKRAIIVRTTDVKVEFDDSGSDNWRPGTAR